MLDILVALRLPDSCSNWNLKMFVFEERGKPEYPEKNLSERGREPTKKSTHICLRRWDFSPGHTGGRRECSHRSAIIAPQINHKSINLQYES